MENLSSVVKIHIRITNINMNSRSAAHYMIKLFCCYNSAFTRKRSDSHKPLCNSQRKLLKWQVIWTLGWNAATLSQTQFASCECHLSAQSHSLQQSACPEKRRETEHDAVWLTTEQMTHYPQSVCPQFSKWWWLWWCACVIFFKPQAVLLSACMRLNDPSSSVVSQTESKYL